jgi:PAS domain S-box-containing protein
LSEIDILKRRLQREIDARIEAENILEKKALELFLSNEKLRELNNSQEQIIDQRTKELNQNKEEYRALIESANDIIFKIDVDGYFTYVSPVCTELTGHNFSKLIGTNYLDLIHPEHKERVQSFYNNAVVNQVEKSYLEFPVIKEDKTELWLGQQVQIDFSDPDSIHITAIARDIQELVRARTALEASEEKYRGIIDGMELGLLEVDNFGKIKKAYRWFCDMTGYTAEELEGQSPEELLLKPEDKSIMESQSDNRKRGQAGVYEIELIRKDGTFIWVAISGAPYYNLKGEVEGSIGVHLDITYQKEMQKELVQAKDNAIKAQMAEKLFLAQMSHEIRTPLNAVLGMSNLLLLTNLDDEQSQYVNDLKFATDILHGLISDVLDLSKIESGELELMLSEIQLNVSIPMICATLNYKAQEQGNTIEFSVDPKIPTSVRADKTILNQILLNLIGNAVKFTTNGTILVACELLETSINSDLLEIKITDNGIGIAPEKTKHIFDRFKQGHSHLLETNTGAGLGLAICKSLVELHGGEISVSSTPYKETTFAFTLRVRKTNQIEGSLKAVQPKSAGNSLNGIYVLIAEDSEINSTYITALMKKWNVKFDLATDGLQAWEKSKRNKYDILLLDMQMPYLMGYEVADRVRNDSSNLNNETPILALSAAGLFNEIEKSWSAGIDDYLTKPYTPEQLHTVITKNLNIFEKVEFKKPEGTGFESLILPQCINTTTLNEIYGDDTTYASKMATLYLKLVPKELEFGNHLATNKDLLGIKSWLHKLAPSLKMMGLSEIYLKCKELEIEIKNHSEPIAIFKSFNHILNKVETTIGSVKILKSKLK